MTADDNLALTRRIYDAFAGRDVATLLEVMDDDIVLRQAPELPWGGEFHGHEGALTFFGTLIGTISSTVTAEGLFAAGDQVVQHGRTSGTVVATGAPFDVPEVHVWTFRDGRAVRFDAYIDTPAMLAALG